MSFVSIQTTMLVEGFGPQHIGVGRSLLSFSTCDLLTIASLFSFNTPSCLCSLLKLLDIMLEVVGDAFISKQNTKLVIS